MYRVAVQRKYVAQHFLVGGNWGAENEKHSHHYQLELELAGEALDEHGFLVDIVDIEHNMDLLVEEYRDRTLNDLAAFKGLNPSLEHFCRILCEALSARIVAKNIKMITVRLWENDIAWASYEKKR